MWYAPPTRLPLIGLSGSDPAIATAVQGFGLFTTDVHLLVGFRLTSVVQATSRMNTALWTRCSSHVMGCVTTSTRRGPRSINWFTRFPIFHGTYDRDSSSRLLSTLALRRPYSLPVLTSIRPTYPASDPHCARQISWIPGFNRRGNDIPEGSREGQEEAAKAAILERAMKGRQPTELMLRCESFRNVKGSVCELISSFARYHSRCGW